MVLFTSNFSLGLGLRAGLGNHATSYIKIFCVNNSFFGGALVGMSELIAFSLQHGVSSGTLHLVSLRSISRIRFKASFFLSGKFWFQLFYFLRFTASANFCELVSG